MAFLIEPHLPKEEIFQKSDDECADLAKTLRSLNCVYLDPDFLPDAQSLGKIVDEDGNMDFENINDPWFSPDQFARAHGDGTWKIWEDPWPFHVAQGRLGDCWLIAAIQTISRRPNLLEQIIPKRDYTMDCGIVQVRLCIHNQWQVIKIDYHIPQDDGMERCAGIFENQMWVAFIEKAFAKAIGNYGKLFGGSTSAAFRLLTGFDSGTIFLNKDMDLEKLWEDLIVYHSSGFLIGAATPELEDGSEEKKLYNEVSLSHNHVYSVLDFKDHDGHHLIQVGSTSMKRWSGKWSLLTAYDYDVARKFSLEQRVHAGLRTFWIEINDFVRYFQFISVCEYREGWHEKRFKQKFGRKSGQKCQIVRLNVEARQEYVVEVDTVRTNGKQHLYTLFINVHKSTSNDQCGELLMSFEAYNSRITTKAFYLDPGEYFVVFICFEQSETLILDWIIRSNNELDSSSIQFVSCQFSTILESLQRMVFLHGKADFKENDNIIVYTWIKNNISLVMVDNLRKWSYARIRVTDVENAELSKKASWRPVSPSSRCIVAQFNRVMKTIMADEISYQVCISSWFRAPLNWIDTLVYNCGYEDKTTLATVN